MERSNLQSLGQTRYFQFEQREKLFCLGHRVYILIININYRVCGIVRKSKGIQLR